MDQDQPSSMKPTQQQWICHKCGSSNHARMKTCWQCNTSPIFPAEPRSTVYAIVLYLITFAVTTSIAVLVILVLQWVYSTPIPFSLFSIPVTWAIIAILTHLVVPSFLETRPETKDKLRQIVNVVFFAWLVNFSLFLMVAFIIGGVAALGQTEPGKYYIFENGGKYTEVRYWVYTYSLFHEILVILHLWLVLTSPLALLSRGRWSFGSQD